MSASLFGTGVSVTRVYPGFVATGIRERAFGPDGRPLGTRRGVLREGRLRNLHRPREVTGRNLRRLA